MDQQPTKPHQTAVYWDFENIHLSVSDLLNHEQARYKPVDPVVQFDLIMDYVAGFGSVAVNRAYGNWQWYGKYGKRLLNHSVQAVQLFPAGRHAKNGADIRMAVDILDDLQRFPSIGTVVIISGDVDFVAVAQRVRQQGLDVVGIGTADASNQYWIKSCSEFKQYANLLPNRVQEDLSATDLSLSAAGTDNPASLLVTAVVNAQRLRGAEWVSLVDIRPGMLRLDPAFDQQTYGNTRFIDFVRRFDEFVELRQESPTNYLVNLRPGAREAAGDFSADFEPVKAGEILEKKLRPFDIANLDAVGEVLVGLALSGQRYSDANAVKGQLARGLPADQIDGFYDLLRRTSAVLGNASDGYYVDAALSDLRAVRTQVLAGLLAYLDHLTPEAITEEEFVEALGGSESLLEEVARLPALTQLPVPISGFAKGGAAPTGATAAAGAKAVATSDLARLTRQRGIFVPSLTQLDAVAAMLAEAAQDREIFAGEEGVNARLAAIESVGAEVAPRIYKNVFQAHCFRREGTGLQVHSNLVRPEAARTQILGRLFAYLDHITDDPIDPADFARLFTGGNDPDDDLLDEMTGLPPEPDLPVPIRRR